MRVPIIAGNWKMNMNCQTGTKLVKEIAKEVTETDVEVVVCCPSPLLHCVGKAVKETSIRLGAQNMHWEESGAYTGEVSADMLLEAGVQYVIIGHSERRQIFGEADEIINQKVIKALSKNLTPILCVGETLNQREQNQTFEILTYQLELDLQNVTREKAGSMVIAYEPVWAIGTGKTASPDQAAEAIRFIRQQLAKLFGGDISEEIRIIYGGSVKASNATDIMDDEDIDGALIGGASLKADEFLGIVNF